MISYLNASMVTIRKTIPLYRQALPGFLVPVLVLSIASAALTTFVEENTALLLILTMLINAVAIACVFASLLRCQNPSLTVSLSAPRMFHFLFTYVYTTILVGLGLVLLIIPGLWVAMATLLTPIFVLAKGQSGMEAIASSSRAMKGSMLASFWTLVIVSLPIMLAEYVMSASDEDVLVFLTALLESASWTFITAVTVTIFGEINPDGATDNNPLADTRLDA